MNKLCHSFFFTVLLTVAVIVSSCQKEHTLSVSADIVKADYLGDDITLTVKSSCKWTVTANYPPPDEDAWERWRQSPDYTYGGRPITETGWISFDVSTGGEGTTTVMVHVDASSGYSRKGSAVFTLADSDLFLVLPVEQQGKLDRDMSDKLSPEMKRFMGSGIPTYAKILNTKSLNLSGQTFDFMEDLVYFENLEELLCYDCGLTSFTTRMPALKTLQIYNNNITYLDPDLFPNLEYLDCSLNPLNSIDFINAPTLKSLLCAGIPIKELSVGDGLETLICDECGMERLDLSQARSLRNLSCARNNLPELDLSRTQTVYLFCHHNPKMRSLVFPENNRIEILYASNCSLSGELTISSETVQEVDLSFNDLEKLAFGEKSNLEMFYCEGNRLAEIVLPKSRSMWPPRVNCKDNLLSELGPADFNWESSSISGNPGEDGIFTLFVTKNVTEYYTDFYIPSVWQWQWQGQDITVKVVREGSVAAESARAM